MAEEEGCISMFLPMGITLHLMPATKGAVMSLGGNFEFFKMNRSE